MVAVRRTDLLERGVLDELVVFNKSDNEASALNASAAVVFRLCDGTSSVAQMSTALKAAGIVPYEEAAVWVALLDLERANLVELAERPPGGLSRRDLLRRLGVGTAAAVGVSVITTIVAPDAAAQGSMTTTTLPP